MSSLIRRPPARMVIRAPLAGPSNRQNYGAVDSARAQGGAVAGNTATWPDPRAEDYPVHWDDLQQINPAHEQPKLIFYSGAGPFTRWGHRRFVRTLMSASPRFMGRWAFVGAIQAAFVERGRMTGLPGRSGFARRSYTYPRFQTAPRTIELWPVNQQKKGG